jgi:hypothetical protein
MRLLHVLFDSEGAAMTINSKAPPRDCLQTYPVRIEPTRANNHGSFHIEERGNDGIDCLTGIRQQ